jgi:hypothetical protein
MKISEKYVIPITAFSFATGIVFAVLPLLAVAAAGTVALAAGVAHERRATGWNSMHTTRVAEKKLRHGLGLPSRRMQYFRRHVLAHLNFGA